MASYFTQADLLAIWESSVDPLYSQPFVEAGDGGGLEAYTQAFAQLERVSQAIEVTMQSLFILPSSAQTKPSASGSSNAVASVSFSRTLGIQFPIVLTAGMLMVEEQETDWGVDGAVSILTGRRYVLRDNVVFFPGDVGPHTGVALAEAPGMSWNNPAPGAISVMTQPGAGQYNGDSTVVPGLRVDVLYSPNEYGTFVPGHVGQYFLMTSLLNSGRVRRAVTYSPPGIIPFENGGSIGLAQDVAMLLAPAAGYSNGESVEDSTTGAKGKLLAYNSSNGACVVQRTSGQFAVGDTIVGQHSGASSAVTAIDTDGMLAALQMPPIPLGIWIVGETLTQAATGAVGKLLLWDGTWAIVQPVQGRFLAGSNVVGSITGLSIPPAIVGVDPRMISEQGTAQWKVLKWAGDLGFSVANAASPSGGGVAMLDELGKERNLSRANGEADADYARRISRLPDQVSPGAIRRAAAKFFSPHGWVVEFREVGTDDLPGFYYDVPSSMAPNHSSAWDMDPIARPADRFKVWLDYPEFRAFFLFGVPASGMGEFGFAYDAHPTGAYDAQPYEDFYDGCPYLSGRLNARLYADVTERKAGGVGFDLYEV